MKPELDWINEARKHLGLKELNGSNKHPTIDGWAKNLGASWVIGQPWCGTYVAHCLKSVGVKYPKNWYRALAYASDGGVKLKNLLTVALLSKIETVAVMFVLLLVVTKKPISLCA